MREVKLLMAGNWHTFMLQDGLADLIEKLDLQEIATKKITKEREVCMRDIPKEQWDQIALQSYQHEEQRKDQ